MGFVGYLIITTLIGAVVIYFVCGLEKQDKEKGKGNNGCIVAVVISFIFALILGLIALAGK